MPEWTEIDPVSAEAEMGEFLWGLIRMLKPEVIVETGTYHGNTTMWLADAVIDNEHGHVWSCDIDLSIGHLQKFAGRPITFVRSDSLELPELRTADFVFSDSGQETRSKEYELVKSGCVFVVHDTAVDYSGKSDQHWLGKWVLSQGGLNFNAGRGFGILVKP